MEKPKLRNNPNIFLKLVMKEPMKVDEFIFLQKNTNLPPSITIARVHNLCIILDIQAYSFSWILFFLIYFFEENRTYFWGLQRSIFPQNQNISKGKSGK